MAEAAEPVFPRVAGLGIDGFVVSFGDRLSEAANRAALAFRHRVEREGWDGVEESSTSLVSAYVRFDALAVDPGDIEARLAALLASEDWYRAELPGGRRLWRVPTVYGGAMAPQLGEAAGLAGLTEAEAVRDLSTTPLRVQTIGFAPGQPYLGELPPAWDIPRQTELTRAVPKGALTVAIRQVVLFSVSAPTGWRHAGQTALPLFRPDAEAPFLLRPGDEVLFQAVDEGAFARLETDPAGGAVAERLG